MSLTTTISQTAARSERSTGLLQLHGVSHANGFTNGSQTGGDDRKPVLVDPQNYVVSGKRHPATLLTLEGPGRDLRQWSRR